VYIAKPYLICQIGEKILIKNYSSSYKSLGGGALLELSHEIDYIRNLFGDISEVSSHLIFSKNLNIGVESGANLIFKLKNNLIINLILNFDSKIFSRKCRINFNNSKLIWDIYRDKISYTENDKLKQTSLNYIYKNQVVNFLHNIKKKKFPYTSLEDAQKTLRVIDSALMSFKLKKTIKI